MKHTRTSILQRQLLAAASVALLAVGGSAAPAGIVLQEAEDAEVPGAEAGSEPLEVSTGWIVDEADNVCGVRPARQITNPALVRYDELLDATPEIQRMKREGITRDSAQGQVLYAAAVDRVSKAARRVMNARSHCSVWKQVRHRDGRSVADISDEVKAEL